jgi:hypothetical protein
MLFFVKILELLSYNVGKLSAVSIDISPLNSYLAPTKTYGIKLHSILAKPLIYQ